MDVGLPFSPHVAVDNAVAVWDKIQASVTMESQYQPRTQRLVREIRNGLKILKELYDRDHETLDSNTEAETAIRALNACMDEVLEKCSQSLPPVSEKQDSRCTWMSSSWMTWSELEEGLQDLKFRVKGCLPPFSVHELHEEQDIIIMLRELANLNNMLSPILSYGTIEVPQERRHLYREMARMTRELSSSLQYGSAQDVLPRIGDLTRTLHLLGMPEEAARVSHTLLQEYRVLPVGYATQTDHEELTPPSTEPATPSTKRPRATSSTSSTEFSTPPTEPQPSADIGGSMFECAQNTVINGGTFIACRSLTCPDRSAEAHYGVSESEAQCAPSSLGNVPAYALLGVPATLASVSSLSPTRRGPSPVYYEDLPIFVAVPLLFAYMWRFVFGQRSVAVT